jgi:hypothetical protein
MQDFDLVRFEDNKTAINRKPSKSFLNANTRQVVKGEVGSVMKSELANIKDKCQNLIEDKSLTAKNTQR